MLALKNETFQDKTVAISGFGNVSWGTTIKVNELGGKVVTLSGPDGYIYDKDGIKGDKVDYLLEMRASNRDMVKDYADKYSVPFYEGKNHGKLNATLLCHVQLKMNSMVTTLHY